MIWVIAAIVICLALVGLFVAAMCVSAARADRAIREMFDDLDGR